MERTRATNKISYAEATRRVREGSETGRKRVGQAWDSGKTRMEK